MIKCMNLILALFHENDNESSLPTASFDGFRGWEQHVSSFGASRRSQSFNALQRCTLSWSTCVFTVFVCLITQVLEPALTIF